MKPVTTLIIDDESLCRKGIRLLLEQDPEFQILGECADGREAVRTIVRLKPEVIFLDIQMPEAGGFEVLKALPEEGKPVVVFVTAYDQHAVRAFEAQALDYILKPFSQARFQKTLDNVKARIREKKASAFGGSLKKLIDNWEETPSQTPSENAVLPNAPASVPLEQLLVGERDARIIIRVKDIEWIEGADYYIRLHTRNKSYFYRERLKVLEDRLPPHSFVRVHKSAIINLQCLDRLVMDNRNRVAALLLSGTRVKVSRSRAKDLIARCRARS